MTSVYLDVSKVPLDKYDLPDLGDMPAQATEALDVDELLRLSAEAAAPIKRKPRLVVPFTRTLEEGDVGRDVVGAKRMVWRANGLHLSDHFTQDFGPIAKHQLQIFQHGHGLHDDGVLGPETLKKLAPFADRYAFLLYAGYPPGGTADERVRRAIVAYCLWGYNNRPRIHYALLRPMSYMSALEHLDVWEDCSTFATKAYKFADAPDPNAMSYDGYGNTGTMRLHGRRILLADAKPGDLVHYDGPQHVAVCVGAGRVVSLGSEIGPLLVDATYRPISSVMRYQLLPHASLLARSA